MEYSSVNAAFNPPSPPSHRGGGVLFSSPDKGRSGGVGVAGFGARVVSMVKLAGIAACLLVAPLAQAGAIDKLHRFLETTKTLRADFVQIVVAKNGKKPQQSTGVMMISRPGKFRWQINKPYAQLLVGDGEKVWIYDEDLRQVTVKKFDAALGSTPAALLVGGNALDKNFTLREVGEREGIEWLEAIPKSTDSGFEKLQMGFVGNDLKAMELFDNFGQATSLIFTRFERNPQIAPALFHFTPPAGVDVIGE